MHKPRIVRDSLNMNFNLLKFILMFACFALPQAFAQEDSRLLPDSFVKTVGFAWQQDGRAVEIQVTNPRGKWVLLRLVIYARFEDGTTSKNSLSRTDAKSKMATSSGILALEQYLNQLPEVPEVYPVTMELQPGKEIACHLEMQTNRRIISLSLVEIRGREKTRFEHARNLLW